jgi:cytoskeletal protein RodZ
VGKSFEQTGTGASGFGERLRREREMRGISLDDISAATKIGTRLLRALEEEHFEALPGGIFNKGYVRAYAKYVGIGEEQTVAEYLTAAGEAAPDVRLIAQQNSSTHGDPGWSGPSVHHGRFSFVPVVILLLVSAGAVGGWHLYQQRQSERRESNKAHEVAAVPSSSVGPAAIPNSSVKPAPEPTGTTPSVATPANDRGLQAPPNAAPSVHAAVPTVEAAENLPHSGSDAASGTGATGPEGGKQFEVTVRAKDFARVEMRSDGEVVVRAVIKPSEVRTFHATKRLVFWTANAGDIELSFNGKAVPLKGGENDEQVLVFNSHGLLPPPTTQ